MEIVSHLVGKKDNSLVNLRQNPLTTTARAALGATLSSAHTGLSCYDTDLNLIFWWNGSTWTSGVAQVAGAMTYKGAYSDLVNVPAGAVIGDTYVINASGTLTWAGQTFAPTAIVQAGDMIIKRTATAWDIVEGNNVSASETVSGNVRLSTQAEASTGTDDTTAISPLKLKTLIAALGLARSYFINSITLVANTPFTITHNLGLQNKDAFVASVKNSAGSEVGIDIDSVDTNSLTITSTVAITGLKVTVIGR